jgi:hypothetical protein
MSGDKKERIKEGFVPQKAPVKPDKIDRGFVPPKPPAKPPAKSSSEKK